MGAELLLREQKGRAGGCGDDRAGLAGTRADDVIVRRRADAAFHVGVRHRRLDQVRRLQRAPEEPAGQIEAAAGLGADNALGLARLRNDRRADEQHCTRGSHCAGELP